MIHPNHMWPSLHRLPPLALQALKWVRENRATRHTTQELENPFLNEWRDDQGKTVEVEVHAYGGGKFWIYIFTFANGIKLEEEKGKELSAK